AKSLRLDFNEWIGSENPNLKTAVQSFDLVRANMYPEGEKVLGKVSEQFGVRTSQLLLTNGTDEAFSNVYRTFLNPGDKVLIPDPGYTMMTFYTLLCQGTPVSWPLHLPTFDYDWNLARDFAKEGGKIVTLARPNNPTGSGACIDSVLEYAQSHPNQLVLVDEAYGDFAADTLIPSALASENLLVLRTFSKAWGLAGLRVGAVIGPEVLLRDLKKTASPYSVNAFALHVLEALLPDKRWPARATQLISESRETLKRELNQRGMRTHFGGGNFFLMYLGKSLPAFLKAMEARGVRLRDQSSKRGLENWVRVSIGAPEITKRFINLMDESLTEAAINPREVV
ncbi:MAG: histidinol-phosphate aminotransferase family protein, partial [Candidatus Eisenbacteria bacterium]|nr:histidinol-phosphate aminotransferase family protein [Candidatus Eisenbacteria bacterium]